MSEQDPILDTSGLADSILRDLDADDFEMDDAPAAPSDGADSPESPTADDPAASAPEAPVDDAGDPPPASAPATSATPASADTPAPTSEAPAEPFVISVDGKRLPVEGATIKGDTITIPKDVWEREIRPKYVADRSTWRTKEQQYQQAIRQLQDGGPAQAKYDALSQQFEQLLGITDDQQRWEAMEALRAALPIHQAKAEAEFYRRQAEALHAPVQAEQHEAQVTQLRSAATQYVESVVADLLTNPQFREYHDLAGAKDRLTAVLTRDAAHFITGVTAGPDGTPQFSTNAQAFWALVQDEAGYIRQHTKHQAELKAQSDKLAKIEAAAARNAEKAAGPKHKAPPAVAAKGSPSGVTQQKTAGSIAELRRQMLEDIEDD
jgi:hypothetical protein